MEALISAAAGLPLAAVAFPTGEGEVGPVLILAVIQGLTEFLPISSSGHLVLAESRLGLGEASLALNVALHVGTLLAALGVFGIDLWRVVRDLFGGRPRPLLALIVGTLPAVAFGVLLKLYAEDLLASPVVAGFGLVSTAVLLTVGELARRRGLARAPEADDPVLTLSLPAAFAIGCAQAFAILPGVSRSGSTIAIAMACKVHSREAARFSFLLSVPAIGGAAMLELPDALEAGLAGLTPLWLGAAILLSAVVGYGALRVLLGVLERGAFTWFAGYCALLGLVVIFT